MRKRSLSDIAADELLYKNPLLIRMLGLSTAVFASTAAKNALAMGLCALAVLMLSAVTLSVLRGVITDASRKWCVLFTVCGYTTLVHLFVRAFFHGADAALGIYLPLIAVSGLCFTHGSAIASRVSPVPALLDALFVGLGYLAAMTVAAVIRELFGMGSFFGIRIFNGGVAFLATPAGGFILFGILAAAVTYFSGKRRDSDEL